MHANNPGPPMNGVERTRHYERQVQPTCGKAVCCGPDFGRIFIYTTPYDTCPYVRTARTHNSGVQAHFSWSLLQGLHLFRGINGGKEHSVHCQYMPIPVDEMTRINTSLVYMQNHAALEAPGPRPLVSSGTFFSAIWMRYMDGYSTCRCLNRAGGRVMQSRRLNFNQQYCASPNRSSYVCELQDLATVRIVQYCNAPPR